MSGPELVMLLVLVVGVGGAAFVARMFQEFSVGRYKPRPGPPSPSPSPPAG